MKNLLLLALFQFLIIDINAQVDTIKYYQITAGSNIAFPIPIANSSYNFSSNYKYSVVSSLAFQIVERNFIRFDVNVSKSNYTFQEKILALQASGRTINTISYQEKVNFITRTIGVSYQFNITHKSDFSIGIHKSKILRESRERIPVGITTESELIYNGINLKTPLNYLSLKMRYEIKLLEKLVIGFGLELNDLQIRLPENVGEEMVGFVVPSILVAGRI